MKRFSVILLAAFEVACAIVPQTALGGSWRPGNPLDVTETPMPIQPARETKAQLDRRMSAYEAFNHLLPKDAEGWFELGAAYLAAARPKDAVNPLRSAVKLNPGYFEAWNCLGICLSKTGSMDESIDAFQHVIEIRPDISEGWVNLSLDFIKNGRLFQAEKYLKKALALDPASKVIWNSFAHLRATEGKTDEALLAVDNSLKIDPRFCYALFNRGLLLYSKHDVKGAIECMQRAVHSASDFMHARVVLEIWLADANRLEEAAWVAKGTLVHDPAERNSLDILAACDIKNYRLQDGIKETMKARALGYDGVDSLSNLTTALTEFGRFEEAEKLVTKAMEANPKDENPVVFLGMIRLKQKRLEEGGALFKKALEMNPKNLRARLSLAESYRLQGRQDEAIQCAKQALEQDPRNAEAWVSVGASEEKRMNMAAAGDAYRKATEVDPGNYRCWRSLAWVSPDYAKACEAARKALALAPDERATQALLPAIQRKFKKNDEAIASCESTLRESPENITAAREYYGMLVSLGRLQEGEVFFRDLTRMHSSSALGWMMLGQVYDGEKKYGDAREALLKSVKLAPGNAISWIGLGTISMENSGHHRSPAPGASADPVVRNAGVEAETSIRKALVIEPANAIAYERLSMALIFQNRYDEAQTAARKAISLDGQMANAQFDLATCFFSGGDIPAAIEPFEASVRLAPGDFDHWAGLLACYREMKDLQGGEEEFRKLAAELPDASAARFFLGTILGEQGKNREAIESYLKAIAMSKVFPSAWNSMGLAHRDLGEMDKAVECFRKAVEETRGYAEAWNNMGFVYFTGGRLSEAIGAYQHALEADPIHVKALVNLAQAAAQNGNVDLASKTCDRLAKVNPALADETRRRVLPAHSL